MDPKPESLEDRKAAVLRAVVQDYIRTAEPVGSAVIAERYRLGVSPATIRNELAALEEMGFLTQPHTSAGRIPTDLGYRFFVDALPSNVSTPKGLAREIATFFEELPADVDAVADGTASLLSRLTGYAAIALSPSVTQSTVVRAELVSVGSSTMLLVVGDTGRVDKRVLDVGADPRLVESASRLLSERLSGLSYGDAADRATELAREIAEEERRLVRDVAEAIRKLGEPGSEHLYVGGMANIADEGAFGDRRTLRELVEALEERSTVLEVLQAASSAMGEVTVKIGRENALEAMAEASLVVAWYAAKDQPTGAIAILGPTRMEYPKAISAAQTVAGRLSDLMAGFAD